MSLLLFCLLHILLRKKQGLYVIICKATRQVSYSYFNKANWTLKWNSELIRVYFLTRETVYILLLFYYFEKNDEKRWQSQGWKALVSVVTSNYNISSRSCLAQSETLHNPILCFAVYLSSAPSFWLTWSFISTWRRLHLRIA